MVLQWTKKVHFDFLMHFFGSMVASGLAEMKYYFFGLSNVFNMTLVVELETISNSLILNNCNL